MSTRDEEPRAAYATGEKKMLLPANTYIALRGAEP